MKEKWYFMPYQTLSGRENMAIDEYFLDFPRKCPLLRGYGFIKPTVTVGRLQKVGKSFQEECMAQNVEIVKRISGGRAVLHYQDFTYSIIIPKEHTLAKLSVMESYKEISHIFSEFFKRLSLNVQSVSRVKRDAERSELCFELASYYELLIGGKKIIGSAQCRKKYAVLQHGTLLQKIDATIYEKLFGLKASKELFENFTSLEEVDIQISEEALYQLLLSTFQRFNIELEAYHLTEGDRTQIKDYLLKKYL
ncbi:MAG: biotin/lipoate A/B protein ligase family protein [Fusobacteria bacterium]|nr:biotin/lipoate A/B protein ligase family protein [Fusobacteriota bacterium]